MRLQEVHPALVHFPLALLPTSLVADLVGRVTGSDALTRLGRQTMPLAAASGVVAGAFGLVAQEVVRTDGHATDLLVTHRNLNLAAIGLMAGLAAERARVRRPGWAYLASGLAGLAAVAYASYLGGHMVYQHGVGVSEAHGLVEARAPEITGGNLGEVVRATGRHLGEGVRHAVQELGQGQFAPGILQTSTGSGQAS